MKASVDEREERAGGSTASNFTVPVESDSRNRFWGSAVFDVWVS